MKEIKKALVLLGSAAVCMALFMSAGSFLRSEGQNKKNPAATRETEQNKSAQGTVIGYLESRDKVVTITRGLKGSVYTVKTKDGTVLDAKLSDKELETKYPEIHSQIKEGRAGNDASLRKDERERIQPVQPPR
jgi:hypothetical protein